MSDYGLTTKGPNIKRLDTILNEMHDSLSEKWGVNTRQNPESFINHLLTNFADKLAELWEFGESVYYSQYPSYAEGISLDNAAQLGGSTRETATKSYYPIHCTGTDGTILSAGTLIASNTNPPTQLSITDSKEITRSAFNKAIVKIAVLAESAQYSIVLNGAAYTHTSVSLDASAILNALSSLINSGNDFDASVDEDNLVLSIEAKDVNTTNALVLSENLTTETVTTIITFGTVETGNILLPTGIVTNIVKADAGLLSVTNISGYIAGHSEESDSEFRRSYADKIFNRSSMMLESIRSAILNNVAGVVSVAPYENNTNAVDEDGRPPHSIEIVVDGGSQTDIAQQILAKKAGGICTYGDTSVVLPGEYDEDITIRFSRPTIVYIWFHIQLTLDESGSLPSDYETILKNIVLENMNKLGSGDDVYPQEFISELYKACSGLSYIDMSIAATSSYSAPQTYPDRKETITARQKAYTTSDMIEVVLDE